MRRMTSEADSEKIQTLRHAHCMHHNAHCLPKGRGHKAQKDCAVHEDDRRTAGSLRKRRSYRARYCGQEEKRQKTGGQLMAVLIWRMDNGHVGSLTLPTCTSCTCNLPCPLVCSRSTKGKRSFTSRRAKTKQAFSTAGPSFLDPSLSSHSGLLGYNILDNPASQKENYIGWCGTTSTNTIKCASPLLVCLALFCPSKLSSRGVYSVHFVLPKPWLVRFR